MFLTFGWVNSLEVDLAEFYLNTPDLNAGILHGVCCGYVPSVNTAHTEITE